MFPSTTRSVVKTPRPAAAGLPRRDRAIQSVAAGRFLKKAALRLLAACSVTLALVAPAWADVSRDQAAAAAQRQTGGRVLSVDKTESGRRPMWRVKVVTPKGEVRVVFIDAGAGRGD